ncbi:hypothetical protein ACTFIU_001394 [Dictyostelium citrinum]
MQLKLIFILIFYTLFFISINSLPPPHTARVKFEDSKLIYIYDKNDTYFTRLVLYKDMFRPRSEMAPNYFNCTISENDRICVFHSDEPFSRLWGTVYSRACFREESNGEEDCRTLLAWNEIPEPFNVKFSRLPPTSGGDIVINGTFLRLVGGPNTLDHSIAYVESFHVKGNFSDPSFNCNSIIVTIPPGSGKFNLYFDDEKKHEVPFSYSPPIISSTTTDISKSIIIINGNNFYTDNSLVKVYYDNIQQQNITITLNHTQIQVGNLNISDPGPISVHININGLSIEKNYSACIPATINSISSVSSHIGGIVTIIASKLISTSKPSLIPIVEIGGHRCSFIQSNENTILCQLNPDKSGGKNIPISVSFGGCYSIINGIKFSYDIPTLSYAVVLDGVVNIIGLNLASLKEQTLIEVNSEYSLINTIITEFQVSPDEKKLSFELPRSRCESINIMVTHGGVTSILRTHVPSFKSGVFKKPSSVNGTLVLELYNIICPFVFKHPTITFGNSTPIECSVPALQIPMSDFYLTSCPAPYGTGNDKQYTLDYNIGQYESKYSYAPPIIESRSFSEGQTNITIHGSNFGNSLSLIKVFFNGSDISSEISSVSDSQFSFKKKSSYENGMMNITVDGINMESLFYVTLPPIIYSINDALDYSCSGKFTIHGKNLLTKDEEFQVKVLANDQNTTKIYSNEKILYVKTNSIRSPINASVYIGKYLILSKPLIYYKKKNIHDPYYDSSIDNC